MFSNIRFSMNISIKYDIGIDTQNCQYHTHHDPYHHTPTLKWSLLQEKELMMKHKSDLDSDSAIS